MGDTIKHIPKEDRCQFCGKQATILCDMPIGKVVRHARGAGFNGHILTCDKKICTGCTTRVSGFDFCPDCVRKIKAAKKGVTADER